MENDSQFGVVGLGASGVVTTISLIRELIRRNSRQPGSPFQITVFEPNGPFPGGIAYGTPHDVHVLNMRASTMSIHSDRPDSFVEWLRSRPGVTQHHPVHEDAYVPRSAYRHYLADQFAEAVKAAEEHGGSVRVVPSQVTDVSPRNDGVYLTSSDGVARFDQVILCPGESHHPPHHSLAGHPRYIASSWDYQSIEEIPADASVGIIGTSLSAIDVVLLLRAQGHKGPLHAVSRVRPLPKVQGAYHRHELKYLTRHHLRLLTCDHTRPLTLSDVSVLFRLELQDALGETVDWENGVLAEIHREDHARRLAEDIRAAESGNAYWYCVLDATGDVILDYWHHLDAASRQLFEQWRPYWMTYRHCMPLPTARTLLDMMEQQHLTVSTGMREVTQGEAGDFRITTHQAELYVDYVVNARGVSGDSVRGGPPLVQQLLASGTAVAHPDGGLRVEFDTARVYSRDGHVWPHLFLVGPQTSGVHFYTNSMETIMRNADQAARAAVAALPSSKSKSLAEQQ
ncbi:FAD/NAD(P)-binding protein [Streptomyces sp. MspMP-M5]|uniref:FAD/NAD(P)-binding protein n=1 Tax=unclassified Streptomyces TaxID=2593676 RepID=UPI00036174E3|nr:FAD/NAD(P)-binding protein [Streptomyces sp. MspMP-M5]MYT33823.1 hypothetical protein [Streptomyces sp. SID8354]